MTCKPQITFVEAPQLEEDAVVVVVVVVVLTNLK